VETRNRISFKPPAAPQRSPGRTWRLSRPKDTWQPSPNGFLGGGGFGQVTMEECINGPAKGKVRAVKQIGKANWKSAGRELEALTKFSNPSAPEVFTNPTHQSS
jgi:hypothetical protein